MTKHVIPEAALKAAAWEISAVDYPNYEPDLDLARKVLEAALPHIQAQTLDEAVDAFPLETIVAPDNAVVWMHRRAEDIRARQ